MYRSKSVAFLSLVSLTSLLGTPALAKNTPGELIKYLNPLQKKGYLNESQDRVIKKKKFKSVAIEGAQSVANKEIGLFATIDAEQAADESYLKDLLAQPAVNGLSYLASWRSLEPEEGKYSWQTIDNLLKLCAEKGKSLILRVSTCGLDEKKDLVSDTPQWVFDAGSKSVEYKGADGNPHKMPIYWDSTYLAKWSNFVNTMGERYDKNNAVHSIGITGGGVRGGTAIVPDFSADKQDFEKVDETLKKDHGMNQRQLVEHWKYVADLFPHAFKVARLNFDIDPPTPNRAGEDTLDEISDYLVYRYGQRVYLTRQNVANAKHGFDQYRVLLKFKPDTLTGYELSKNFPAADLDALCKNALNDGISYVEVPAGLFKGSDNEALTKLDALRSKLGYQLVAQKIQLPPDLKSGQPLKASFTFVNLGSAAPMRPSRQFDKDVVTSYKVQLELRDRTGKAAMLSLHTPSVPTNKWLSGQPISWEEELKTSKLKPGEYSVYLSMVDADTKRKLQFLDAATGDKPKTESTLAVGKIQVVAE